MMHIAKFTVGEEKCKGVDIGEKTYRLGIFYNTVISVRC
jgi:hypothetical protein